MVHPVARFQEEAKERLAAALETVAPGTTPRFVYAEAPEGKGDFAAGCFPLAAALKKNPAEIASLVADAVEKGLHAEAGTGADALDARPWVAKAEAAGPYVNLHMDPGRLMHDVLTAAHTAREDFADLPARDQKVILEHTSANPNGPLHVGRARNPVIGDTLVRTYRRAGYDTEAQYYVDDMGKQVAILTWGLENLDEEQVTEAIGPARIEKVDHVQVRYYQAANAIMEKDPETKDEIQRLILATEEGDPGALERVEKGYETVLEGMMQTLGRMNVAYDRFVKESVFVENGDTERVIDALASQDEVEVGAEGKALYLDLATKGVKGRSTKFFFRRSDGSSLYATRDVAYHLWKAKQADRLVNVLGEDHRLQAVQVKTCLELLDAPHIPEVVFYSFVSLPEGKMSTRRNRVVFIDDLIDEAVARAYEEVKQRRGDELSEDEMKRIAETVGVGAIRFSIAKVQPEKSITFKWEEALAFDGFAAPFIQYSHARVAGILDRAHAEGLDPSPGLAHLLVHPSEVTLAKTVAKTAAVVSEVADTHKVHLIPEHAYAVATAFNAFYRDCHVMQAGSEELTRARLALVEAARLALAVSLDLLGIEAPRQM